MSACRCSKTRCCRLAWRISTAFLWDSPTVSNRCLSHPSKCRRQHITPLRQALGSSAQTGQSPDPWHACHQSQCVGQFPPAAPTFPMNGADTATYRGQASCQGVMPTASLCWISTTIYDDKVARESQFDGNHGNEWRKGTRCYCERALEAQHLFKMVDDSPTQAIPVETLEKALLSPGMRAPFW